ncbi:MAG: DUF3108 domain-containing protein [Alphaproteobacteria bacterium]|nr:DUF3108 domain-containing protein [Alphaproteobacteria bacterium]
MSGRFALASLAMICLSGVAQAAENPGARSPFLQKMKFEVYASGVNAVSAELQVDLREKDRYRMIFGAETEGFLASMVPWEGTFESKGWVLPGGKQQPELHQSIASWKKEQEIKTYHYSKDGTFLGIETKYTTKKPKNEVPDKALTDQTTDVLTATLVMMEELAKGKKCDSYSEIYDGKRRYGMSFQHQRYVMIKPSRYNVYSGPAVECIVEVIPRGGDWGKKPRGWLSIQEQGRARGTMPTVWFAMVGENNNIAVPVRVRVKTAYGTLFMHMTYFERGDTILTQKK